MANGEEQYKLKLTDDATEAPWYTTDIEAVLQPQTRQMLEEYAGIPQGKQVDHIERTRKAAWNIAPYPSIGALTWLNPYITLHPAHSIVLEKAKEGATIIDCGCFISPDLRYLASQGAPTKNLYGFDIEERFFDVGYAFYNDKDRWEGKFLAADATKPLEETKLAELIGRVDVIWCPKYLHMYDRPHQISIACNLVQLLKQQPGSLFIGSQNGHPEPQEIPHLYSRFDWQHATFYMGNAETIKEMWEEVGERTGTKWEVEARLLDLRTIGLHEDDGSAYKRMTGYNLQWIARLVEVT